MPFDSCFPAFMVHGFTDITLSNELITLHSKSRQTLDPRKWYHISLIKLLELSAL